jgi:hypothetical protein
MVTEIPEEAVRASKRMALVNAAQRLSKTDKGRDALRRLLDWMEEGGGLSLDGRSKSDVALLLQGAWGEFAGTAREEMHAALGCWE